MCGVAGFAGIKSAKDRHVLTMGLGWGIDTRGGHASGYCSVNGRVNIGKKLGKWEDANTGFIKSAASGDIAMLHARYATCGKKTVNEAHPFIIKRDGETKLYGIHNGMVYNGFEKAKELGYSIDVDSEIMFHLLADGKIDLFDNLNGYGVINYIDPKDPKCVNVVCLSSHADFYIVSLKWGGGYVWGSTKKIVEDALNLASLTKEKEWDMSEVGRVFKIRPERLETSDITGIKFGSGYKYRVHDSDISYYGGYGSYSRSDYWNTQWEKDRLRSNWKPSWMRKDEKDEDPPPTSKLFTAGPDTTRSGSSSGTSSGQLLLTEGSKSTNKEINKEEKEQKKTEPNLSDKTLSDPIAMFECEKCKKDVHSEDFDKFSWWYTQADMYDPVKDPLLCEDCLYDSWDTVSRSIN